MSHPSTCTVVVVTYQSAAVITDCLTPLVSHFPCIIVDNASTDDTRRLVSLLFPQTLLIANDTNHGFGRACNQGLRKAETDYVLLLNPDARITPEAVQALMDTATRYPDAAIIAPVMHGSDGTPQVTYRTHLFNRSESGRDYQLPEGPACAEFLSGAVMLLRREAVLAFGGFDPGIFLFFEDDDLCLQARKAGHALIITPAATAMHAGAQGSAPNARVSALKQRHFAWSRLYVERKYGGQWAARSLGMRLLAQSLIKTVFYNLTAHRKKAGKHMARLTGYARWLMGKPAD